MLRQYFEYNKSNDGNDHITKNSNKNLSKLLAGFLPLRNADFDWMNDNASETTLTSVPSTDQDTVLRVQIQDFIPTRLTNNTLNDPSIVELKEYLVKECEFSFHGKKEGDNDNRLSYYVTRLDPDDRIIIRVYIDDNVSISLTQDPKDENAIAGYYRDYNGIFDSEEANPKFGSEDVELVDIDHPALPILKGVFQHIRTLFSTFEAFRSTNLYNKEMQADCLRSGKHCIGLEKNTTIDNLERDINNLRNAKISSFRIDGRFDLNKHKSKAPDEYKNEYKVEIEATVINDDNQENSSKNWFNLNIPEMGEFRNLTKQQMSYWKKIENHEIIKNSSSLIRWDQYDDFVFHCEGFSNGFRDLPKFQKLLSSKLNLVPLRIDYYQGYGEKEQEKFVKWIILKETSNGKEGQTYILLKFEEQYYLIRNGAYSFFKIDNEDEVVEFDKLMLHYAIENGIIKSLWQQKLDEEENEEKEEFIVSINDGEEDDNIMDGDNLNISDLPKIKDLPDNKTPLNGPDYTLQEFTALMDEMVNRIGDDLNPLKGDGQYDRLAQIYSRDDNVNEGDKIHMKLLSVYAFPSSDNEALLSGKLMKFSIDEKLVRIILGKGFDTLSNRPNRNSRINFNLMSMGQAEDYSDEDKDRIENHDPNSDAEVADENDYSLNIFDDY